MTNLQNQTQPPIAPASLPVKGCVEPSLLRKRAAMLAFVIIAFAAHHTSGQSTNPPLTLQAGQSMYIVAFRQLLPPIIADPVQIRPGQLDYINYDLDAERKV